MAIIIYYTNINVPTARPTLNEGLAMVLDHVVRHALCFHVLIEIVFFGGPLPGGLHREGLPDAS